MWVQDAEGQGVIGVRELEEPLISVGLATSRDDVINLVAAASHDGTGNVTFDDFLDLMGTNRLPGTRDVQCIWGLEGVHTCDQG